MFSDPVLQEFVDTAHAITWCTVATVDRRGRPRSRVLHPVWSLGADGVLSGVVATRPTPLKVAHVAHRPAASCSYWHPDQDVAVAECHVAWVPDAAGRRAAWETIAATPPPAGYDPTVMWPGGPDMEDFAVLALRPWRVMVRRAPDFTAGVPARVWSADAPAAASAA
jgi:hypothetical protein